MIRSFADKLTAAVFDGHRVKAFGPHVQDVARRKLKAIDAAKAQVAGAEANLEASVNRAPDDGRVLERIVEVGGSAKVGEPMISPLASIKPSSLHSLTASGTSLRTVWLVP